MKKNFNLSFLFSNLFFYLIFRSSYLLISFSSSSSSSLENKDKDDENNRIDESNIWNLMNSGWNPTWEDWPRLGICRENKSILPDIRDEVCIRRYCFISWKTASLINTEKLTLTRDINSLTFNGNLHECSLPTGGQTKSEQKNIEVSFIFTLHNNDKISAKSILEVFRTAHEISSAEFIIINDGSTEDMSMTYYLIKNLQDLFNTNIKLIEHTKSKGYGLSNNIALDNANGRYAILLNSDVIVLPGWLTLLYRTITSNKKNIGLVGPLFLSNNGKVSEAGGLLFYGGLPHNMGRGLQPNQLALYNKRIVDYISAACVLFNRTLFKKLGLFDSQFQPAYYEDTDASMQYSQYDFETILQPLAVVIHYEGKSITTTEKVALMNIHQQLFQNKHKNLLNRHCPDRPTNCPQKISVHELHAQQTLLRQPNRILILDTIPPEIDNDAASIRLNHIINIFISLDYSITFEPLYSNRNVKYIIQLLDKGINYIVPGTIKELGESILFHQINPNERICPWKVIYVCRREVFFKQIKWIKRICPNIPIIFDTVGLQYIRELRKIELENKEIIEYYADQPEEGLKLLQSRKDSINYNAIENRAEREISLIAISNITFVMTNTELNSLRKIFPQKDIRILSGIYPTIETLPSNDPIMRNGILFIGNLCNPSNIGALNFLIDEILVDHEFPFGFKMHIVLSDNINCPSPILIKLKEHRLVELHISISEKELIDLHNNIKIVIAPLKNAAGSSGKILYAYSLGVPVIATSVAIEGLNFKNEESILVADSGEDFYQTILRLYKDSNLWIKLRTEGHLVIRRYHSYEGAFDEIKRTLNDIEIQPDIKPWICPYDIKVDCPSVIRANQIVITTSMDPKAFQSNPTGKEYDKFILESMYPWLRNKTNSIIRNKRRKQKKIADSLNE